TFQVVSVTDETGTPWLLEKRTFATFGPGPTVAGALALSIAYCGSDTGQFFVDGARLLPVSGGLISTENFCGAVVEAHRQALIDMLQSSIGFEFASTTDLLLTGSGLVLSLRAYAA
ncbi:MAG: hypothetical protein FWC46_02875, partial [Actinomycetia bacterium]|nr:hypothetical protein [Actinomycetes bacterium]